MKLKHFGARDVLVFGVSVAVSIGTAAAIMVSAAGGDGDVPKLKPPRDAPGAVRVEDLPAGEHLESLTAARSHGGILVTPPGDTPNLKAKLDALPIVKMTFERVTTGANDTAIIGLPIDATKLPRGYAVTAGGGMFSTDPSGIREIAEAGFTIEGPGYPITVQRAIPAAALVGEPRTVGAWGKDSNVMTTLGDVRGIPAVFVHRRPGVKTSELQQVWLADGKYIIRVEGYVDEFNKLIAVADAILSGQGRVK